MQTARTRIDSHWRVRELNPRGNSEASDLDWLPAQVPGHVHLDLMRAGVIADPFQRMQERGCAWVDETDWVYETTFTVDDPAPPHAFLLFHGLDTLAEIFLNDEPLGQTDNMFIPHEFPVGGRLRAGENRLRVIFRSALRVGRERQKTWAEAGNATLPAPHWFVWGPRSFVRKAQFMYGWDWGPELVSCGIWRPVELVTVPVARLLGWKHDVEFTEDEQAVVTIAAEVERAPGQEETPLTFTAALTAVETIMEGRDDSLPPPASVSFPAGATQTSVSLTIEKPRRWWPNAHSPENVRAHPFLYTLGLAIDGNSRLDERTVKIGLRTIELIREPDADGQGESFQFRVNGEDIFIKGANWIPADPFPARLCNEPGRLRGDGADHASRVEEPIVAARDAGFNMLRVWGGGLYESERFYELCDEHGILVWQDFPYGCAYYPDTDDYAEAARREATAAVRRIRNHPCLALWCGNNENHAMWRDHWEGSDNLAPRFLGEKLYHEILPAVVDAEDPKTPYWPGSPYGGEDPNSPNFGDCHNWDVWHGRGDWTHYPENDARFLSEFGFASSCGLTAWESCLDESDRWPRSPAVRWHDKTRKGYETYLGYIALHFPEPQTLEELVYYSQINQAEALKRGIEHWRRRKGRCWGTLFWQLNDCWPVQSWAVIDSALEPKAAYYAAKRFYAPVLLSLVRNGDRVEAHLTSDLREPIQGDVTLSVETFDGDLLMSETAEAYVEGNGTAAVATLNIEAVRAHTRDVYVYACFEPYWEIGVGGVENYLFLAEPKDLRLADPGLSFHVMDHSQAGMENNMEIVLTAKRFAPYVWARLRGRTRLANRPDDDNFFHLRAGATKRLIVEKDDLIQTAEDARARLALRSL